MTHLSDLSYIQRGVNTAWFYFGFLIYVFRYDRFEALRPRRLMRLELRSMVTLLILSSLPLQLIYDLGSARIKYLEGFWLNTKTKAILNKPATLWSEDNKELVTPLYYTFAGALALESCTFFLLQSFWNYISKSVTKSSFMSSFEFKVNIVASCFVLILFPTVQFFFRNDTVYREVIPQILFTILIVIIGTLGIRTHFRLVALTKEARELTNETNVVVVQKLDYFKDMNCILTLSFFGVAIPLGICSSDGLLEKPIIAHNKFASDFLVANLNIFEFVIWVTLTLIFYPRRTGAGTAFGSASSGSQRRPASQTEETLPQFHENGQHGHRRNPSHGHHELGDSKAHERGWSNDTLILAPNPTASNKNLPLPLEPPTALQGPKVGKPGTESRTIYYHDSLAAMQKDGSFVANLQENPMPPRRSHDRPTHYRFPSEGNRRPGTAMAAYSEERHHYTPSPAPDRHMREYPSLTQEAAAWPSLQPPPSQRKPSVRVGHDTFTMEPLGRNGSSGSGTGSRLKRSDTETTAVVRDVIQIGYIPSTHTNRGVGPYGSFYEGVGDGNDLQTEVSSRPYSPRDYM